MRSPRRLGWRRSSWNAERVFAGRDREGRSPSGVGVIRGDFLRVAAMLDLEPASMQVISPIGRSAAASQLGARRVRSAGPDQAGDI